jgi:cell division transport system ATP-binding protein
MIRFDHVTKAFGGTEAVSGLTFEIAAGEFVFILGPSGSGKTTVGKLLIAQLKPSEGDITVGDFKLSELKSREIPLLRQQIGVVFQDYKLLHDRTAMENIALALEIAGKSEATVEKTVEELLKVVGLEGKGALFPNQLSGGESQRVVIARALATDPAVLFADEPTGNLDTKNAWGVVELLGRINQHGTTVIMATHDNDIVKKMPKRVLRLVNGKLEADEKHA